MTEPSPQKKAKTESPKKYANFSASKLMLAGSWNPEEFQPQDFIMSEKLDGMRALWDGRKLVSRGGNKIYAPKFFIDEFPSHVALDGELYAGRGQFKKTVSIARKKKSGEEERWRELKYIVFDAPTASGGFESRLAQAETATAHLRDNDGCGFVEIHPHEPCRDLNHLTEELERIEKLDGEGLMMRRKHSLYHHGRSKTDLLKVKTFKDDEGIVYGHQKGTGKHINRMGALLCRLRNGVEFKVGSGFTDKERENPPAIGTIITFRYFEFSKSSGKPRFPVSKGIRTDIDETEFLSGKEGGTAVASLPKKSSDDLDDSSSSDDNSSNISTSKPKLKSMQQQQHPIDASGVLEAAKFGNWDDFNTRLLGHSDLSFADFNELPPGRSFGVVHQISYNGSRDALEKLLDLHPGVDLMLPTKQGQTALQVAQESSDKNGDFIKYLKERMQQQQSSTNKWQYWIDDAVDGKKTGWHDYTKEGSIKVQQLYKNYQQQKTATPSKNSEHQIKIGNFTYILDLKKMTQTNVIHSNNTTRRIRRCL